MCLVNTCGCTGRDSRHQLIENEKTGAWFTGGSPRRVMATGRQIAVSQTQSGWKESPRGAEWPGRRLRHCTRRCRGNGLALPSGPEGRNWKRQGAARVRKWPRRGLTEEVPGRRSWGHMNVTAGETLNTQEGRTAHPVGVSQLSPQPPLARVGALSTPWQGSLSRLVSLLLPCNVRSAKGKRPESSV